MSGSWTADMNQSFTSIESDTISVSAKAKLLNLIDLRRLIYRFYEMQLLIVHQQLVLLAVR